VDHHHRHVLIAFHRDLVLHVHLVDRHVAAIQALVLAADEKAALLFDRQWSGFLCLRGHRRQQCDDRENADEALHAAQYNVGHKNGAHAVRRDDTSNRC
jgi:hypothetical protein